MVQQNKDAVLELDTRKKIYELIQKSPGLHFRELQRRLNIAYGMLQYHLEYMICHNLIEEEKDKEFSRYFLKEFKSIKERELISLLRQKSVRNILLCLLENPDIKNNEISQKTMLSPSTISWHIRRLDDSGALETKKKGGEIRYSVCNPEVVIKLLITYKSSFIDKIVNQFVDVWENEKLDI